ncbi:MAG: hypothetical protein AB7O48_01275 [Cyclobacteriaceae bacterium]
MRLAQLARKIAVKPTDIVSFLASRNIIIEENSNAKVADEYERLVLQHFAPELLISEPQSLEAPVEVSQLAEEPIEIKSEEVEEITDSVESPDREETKEEEKPEVIKPPKVELPGLKVVGKIELPEPKKKVQDTPAEASTEEQPKAEGEQVATQEGSQPAAPREDRGPRDRRRPHRQDRRNRDDQRPRKNPIALQREREEREALRKKLEDQQKEKELRTQRYLKKVEGRTPPQRSTKKAKKKHEDEYEVYAEKQQPKSILGRIMNWFVSE